MEIWLCQACGLVRELESSPINSNESGNNEHQDVDCSCKEFEKSKPNSVEVLIQRFLNWLSRISIRFPLSS